MPEEKKPVGKFEYKIYKLRMPAGGQSDYAAAEQKLLDELAALDEDGWEIAEIFPQGTHFLMKRPRELAKQNKLGPAGIVETDPKPKR
jgi:hypothetical protein